MRGAARARRLFNEISENRQRRNACFLYAAVSAEEDLPIPPAPSRLYEGLAGLERLDPEIKLSAWFGIGDNDRAVARVRLSMRDTANPIDVQTSND
jgi:hypothetical protein